MTVEQQQMIEREYREAVEAGDAVRIQRAFGHAILALVDCQRKTAERVKEMRIDADRAKQRVAGAKWLFDAMKYLAGAGGGAALLKLLGG